MHTLDLADPSIKEIKSWDKTTLLEWIQKKLNVPLDDEDAEKLLSSKIDGSVFLHAASREEFFQRADIPLGPSFKLAQLAQTIIGERDSEQSGLAGLSTVKRKRDSEQVGLAEQSDSASKKARLDWSNKLQLHSETHLQNDEKGTNPLPTLNTNEVSAWKEFYTRAKAIHNKGTVDFSKDSHATVEELLAQIEKVESYNFPKDGDPKLDVACEALTVALQNASKAKVEHDTPEVSQALDNLKSAYDDAAKPNTVRVPYIDVEVPSAPESPLRGSERGQIVLAHPWMKELISGLHNQTEPLLVVGNPGSGKSFALVGYLLFYLNALGERVILQMSTSPSSQRLGFIFDSSGVRELSIYDSKIYNDGKPCYLLVSADGTLVSPRPELDFCSNVIVVTSPNLKSKPDLKEWKKQVRAEQFIATQPSCLEVVYLLSKLYKYDNYLVYWMYQEWTRDFRRCPADCRSAISSLKKRTLSKWYESKTDSIKGLAQEMLTGGHNLNMVHQLPDNKSNLTIPSDLVTIERDCWTTSKYNISFMTPRIANIVYEVQEEDNWAYQWQTLKLYFRNPKTRVAAGIQFQKMFLDKFKKQDPDKMPPCYELGKNSGMHPQSPLGENAKMAMPWKGLGQQPTLEYISIGKDADGSLYSKKGLGAIVDAAINGDSPHVRFIIPCAQNWASWDAAVVLYSEKEGKRALHVIFLQNTTDSDHEILAKGLDQVRDPILAKWKSGEGLEVFYHYVLVLLIHDKAYSKIPKDRPVLLSSKERKKDPSWCLDTLRQYVMFVPLE